MASKYPVKSGYKYTYYRTKLGEPLHQSGYEFDLTDPNCYLLKTEYNNLHDPHLKSFFYNKKRHSHLLSQGYITKDNQVKCSLQEFNEYNNYIHHRMIDLNKQYVKEQEHIKKQIDSINRNNTQLMERIHKREQYKSQLLKKMEKNWQKNDLQLLSQMRKERSQKLQPLEEKKKPVLGIFGDSEDVSSLSSYTESSTVSVSSSSHNKTSSLPEITPNDLISKSEPYVCNLQPAKGISSDLEDASRSIPYPDFSTHAHTKEVMSTSKETPMKSDFPVCDLQYFKDTYSTMFQKIFEAQSAYLSSVSEDLVEIVFDKITSSAPGHHIGFTPVKKVAKETLHDMRGKSPCRYLISRLEVMSAASDIVENALSKWHEKAVKKFSIQYEDIFEERTSFRKLYKFFICANNCEEMYKATLPTATESILESSEEIVKNVLAHLETFTKPRFKIGFKQQSGSAAIVSLKQTSPNSDENALETGSLSDPVGQLEQYKDFLEKELENLAARIDEPEHKVCVNIQELIKTILKVTGANIENDRRQEIGKKITISTEEKFLLNKYIEKNFTPSKNKSLKKHSRILLLTKPHESRVGGKSTSVPDSKFFRAVIEEVNVPGMVTCLENKGEHGNLKADRRNVNIERQSRGYCEHVNFVLSPLDNQERLDDNCFLLNMFNCDHLVHSENEFNRPLKVIEDLVSETLMKILQDLKYPIPEHLYTFVKSPNNTYDVDIAIKGQKDSNALLLPSDIRSFSHHVVEHILKMLYATSSYKKWKECFLSILEDMQNTCVMADCNRDASLSEFYHPQQHIIWEEIAQTVSAKIESFLLLKFKAYLSAEEIIDIDLMRTVPGINIEVGVQTKHIVARLLESIRESISQQQTQDPLLELFSKDELDITCVLLNLMLDHIHNEQLNVILEECQPKSSASHGCSDAGCTLHNVFDRTRRTYSQMSNLLDLVSSTLGVAFKQIMEPIQVKSLKCTSDQSTQLGFETDLSKCCQDSVLFLQTDMSALSKSIVEDLINVMCSAKKKIKEDKSLLKCQGSTVKGICEFSNSVLRDVFGKLRGFISLAVKAIHPSSKNISEEISFPGMIDQENLLYSPSEDLKRKLGTPRPKSNLYMHSKRLSHEMACVIQSQLEKISGNIRHSLLKEEDITSESNSLVFEVEQISLHTSFSQDKCTTFAHDTCIMQNIETNLRRNISQNICAHLKGKESVTPEIANEVEKAVLMLYKQLLIDLSVPLKLTCSSPTSKFHQQLLSDSLLTYSQHADTSPFSDSEIIDLSGDILKILSGILHASNGSGIHDQTNSLKPKNPVFTKLKNFVNSKIISLFCQSIQKPLQYETKKDTLAGTRLEHHAHELADNIIHQAEKHLHGQIEEVFPKDNILPLSDIDIADHIVSNLLLSLKYTYLHQKVPNNVPFTGEAEKNATKCNATEIAEMVDVIIRDTINNLKTVQLSNITLDICTKNLTSSVLALVQRELEQERMFMYKDKKYTIDKNTLATEIVNNILEKFYAKGVSYDTSSTNASDNVDSIYTHTLKDPKVSPMTHSAAYSEPELSTLIQQVETVLHEVQAKTILELKMGISQLSFHSSKPDESSSEYLCDTCLGFSKSDVEFVAKDIVEIILSKLSKHLQAILYFPNLPYEEHCFMLSKPDNTPCFLEQINISHFVRDQSDRTNSMDESFVEDDLLHQLISTVNDKTTAYVATIALKCKPHLTVNVRNENVGTFLARVNNTCTGLECCSKDIVIKVLENIKPRVKRKLLHRINMTQREDIQATHLIDTILHELSSSYNVSAEPDTEYGDVVDYPKASTPKLQSSFWVDELRLTGALSLTNSNTNSECENGEAVNHSKTFTPRSPFRLSVNEQRRFSETGKVSSTSSRPKSDFENKEAIELFSNPRGSTPKPPSLPDVNGQRRFTVPEVVSPTSSNSGSDTDKGEAVLLPQSFTERPSSSTNVKEQRSYNIRLHFL
ncbi:fibrous sheath-interacting protein 2 [Hyla sarda]|uniref:fibrous sheath-interacting protein 2 n=1 Tax=Hyla sarda TaxID=327740 RepID=UPI0024C2205A|nr:fibrous sheath-interacting protein 2 [Hyla sarda]XP_056423456.1 fibrous sheath-interacting protein 2 [Hyla sarda]XP_056423457.1 fibrous sheath-interacting protein 2 [Hyla sarda]XP_056423458.1 fibrous sheath-interacting protein 2 [Hyla sarda]